MSYNLTIDDSSSILNYLPYSDGNFSGGWQTWFSVSGFNTAGGEEAVGDSRHITAFPSASVSLQFHGTAIYLYGNATCPYNIAVDSNPLLLPPTTGELLFSQSGLTPGTHFVNLTALPTAETPGMLFFDSAIVSDILPRGSNTLLPPILIDNQDNATLQYYGNWTDQIDAQVPNRTDPRPFKKTSSSGSSVSLEFNNTIAVAVYGSRNWGHWTYNVSLDGTPTLYNASTWWLVGDALLYYKSGLDPNETHSLEIINEGGAGSILTLNDIQLFRANGSFSSPSNTHTTTSSHKKIGIIVGTILGGCLLIAAILVLIFYWKRRNQTPQAPIRDISPFHQDESTVRETNLNSTHLGSPPITTVLPSQTTPSTVPAISSTFADIQSNQSPSSSSPNHVQGHQTSHTAYASTPSQRIRAKRGANLQHASLPEPPPQYTPNDPEQ